MRKVTSIILASTLMSVNMLFGLCAQNANAQNTDNIGPDGDLNKQEQALNIVRTATGKVTVHFETNGGTPTFNPNAELETGKTIAQALKDKYRLNDSNINPTKSENGTLFVFESWYSDAELTQKVDINTMMVPDSKITLYAKWTKVSTLLDQLSSLIQNIMEIQDGDYTQETMKSLESQYDSVRQLVKQIKEDRYPWNDTINVAINGPLLKNVVYPLQEAYNGLVKIPVDKTNLKALVDKASSLNKADFTAESWPNFENALSFAKQVNDGDSVQSKVNEAIKNLTQAMNDLRKNASETITTESGNKITVQELPDFSQEYLNIKETIDKNINDNSSLLVAKLSNKFDVGKINVVRILDINIEGVKVDGENITMSLAALSDGTSYVLAHYDQSNGKIDGVYEGIDNKNGTFTFSNIKTFSPFALLTAEEKSTPSEGTDISQNGTQNGTPNDMQNGVDGTVINNNPNTGDYQNIILSITLALVGAGGIYTVYVLKKNRDEEVNMD